MLEIEAGSSVHLSELILPEGVTVVALAFGEERDIPVASVTARRGSSDDVEDEVEPAAEADSADAADDEGGED